MYKLSTMFVAGNYKLQIQNMSNFHVKRINFNTQNSKYASLPVHPPQTKYCNAQTTHFAGLILEYIKGPFGSYSRTLFTSKTSYLLYKTSLYYLFLLVFCHFKHKYLVRNGSSYACVSIKIYSVLFILWSTYGK